MENQMPRMTLKQFADAWGQVCEREGARVFTKEPFAEIRIEIEDPCGQKAICCPIPKAICCPITAVCYHVTGELISVFEYLGAGKILGLRIRTINALVKAADNTVNARRSLRQMLIGVAREKGTKI